MIAEAYPLSQPSLYHLQRPDVIYPPSPKTDVIDFDPMSLFRLPDSYDFIDDQGRLCVRNGHLLPVGQYWEQEGMRPEVIGQILDSRGGLRYKVSDEEVERLFEVSPQTAGLRMVDLLRIFYGNSQHALNASIRKVREGRVYGQDGMAAHDENHASDVVVDSIHHILQAAQFRGDIGLQEVYETAFSAAGHDVGQVLQTLHRTGQEQASIFLLQQVMPAFAEKYPEYWQNMVRAIMLHPEANLVNFIKKVNEGRENSLTSAETIQMMYDALTPVTLALVLADKLQIGQHRLPPDWRDFNGLLRDWHIAINACYTTRAAGYSHDGKVFRINFEYTAGPENDTRHKETTISPNGKKKNRYWMPPQIDKTYMRDRPKKDRVAHSEVIEAMMWDQYSDRLRLTIMTAFALNPATETVEINFHDPNARKALGGLFGGLLPRERIDEVEDRTYVFHRNDVDRKLKEINLKFKDRFKIDLDLLRRQGHELRPLAPIEAGNDRREVS